MKLIELVNARFSLQKLVAQDLPLPAAFKLYKRIGQLNQHLEFYGEQVNRPNCDKEALDNMEIEDVETEKVPVEITEQLRLSASDIKALEPFIMFVEVSE